MFFIGLVGGEEENELNGVVFGGSFRKVANIGGEEKKCMRELDRIVELNNNSKRTRWDLSFLIRSRGRWGKCG